MYYGTLIENQMLCALSISHFSMSVLRGGIVSSAIDSLHDSLHSLEMKDKRRVKF